MIVKLFWIMRAILYKFYFKKVGFLSYIGRPLFICNSRKIILGSRVRIFPGLRMEVVDKNSLIKIYDNVSIGQNLHIISKGDLIIEENTTISGNVLITNLDHSYQEVDKHIMDQPHIINKTRVGANCFIGYGAVIQAGTILGKQCIVGANSVVRGTFPDYCVIVGTPARIVKRYNADTKEWQKTDKKGNFV